MNDLYQNIYSIDILNCLASLSNDEVFTPPRVANAMLDMLPQELFEDPNTKFLDPCSKSGVFLREIAKRLIKGLKSQFPNLQERLNHIYKNQIYGIAITELTSLISRRSLYCCKYANIGHSVVQFENIEGNIRFKNIEHSFKKGRCIFCGASESEYGEVRKNSNLEVHAYELIHTTKPEEILNMKFDVIIGNPPYQMSFGISGGNKSNAKSIYNLFISQAIKLNPRYLCMITPSRWMTKTAQGIPESWVDSMLQSNKFKIIHDFDNTSDCFPGITLTGGVSYFLWIREYEGICSYYFHQNNIIWERHDYLDSKNYGIVVRDPKSYDILNKIEKIEGVYYSDIFKNFSGLVSPKHFFDDSNFLTSNWKGYKNNEDEIYSIKYYLNINNDRTYKWISESQIPKNKATKDVFKVYIPAANGSNTIILGKPFIGEKNSVCSQTYLVIGYDPIKHNFSEQECKNIITYIQTRFFRYLVSIKKKTQNGPRGVYQFVPMQDFSKSWTDEELYKKYNLSDEEISFIESMIKPMNLEADEK